ncbi:hypothetical protein GCM10007416_08940 [Kroppenstedtia guangzhouensis]|jgi:hypothetical protein|uniref:Uncharacterized protein n=2 Tax=Kroppenstedtia guangzhouensis TaxID=1274356 RepID=A0ABQ1G7D9_9BACL|nr:hypothetical protein GCM10007416_08940 [Kroppenstedtia guangzhouensis]
MTEAHFPLRPPAKISQVEGYRVIHQKQIPFRVNRGMQEELEQVLAGIHQMAGMRSFNLPDQYVLFRFPNPVVLTSSPPGHPIREMIVTPPTHHWDQPRLLLKNPQNQWVEYKSDRTLLPLANQFKVRIKQRSH